MTQKDRTIVIKLRWTDYDRAGRCAFRVNRKRGTCAEEPQDFASGICTESKTRDRIDDMIDVASNGADLRHLMGGSLPRRSILLKVASGEQFFDLVAFVGGKAQHLRVSPRHSSSHPQATWWNPK